jgi:hypothetical protein
MTMKSFTRLCTGLSLLALAACGGSSKQQFRGVGELAYYDSQGQDHILTDTESVDINTNEQFVDVKVNFADGSFFIFDADHAAENIFSILRPQGCRRTMDGEVVDFQIERGRVTVSDSSVEIELVGSAEGYNIRDTFGYRFTSSS